MGGEYASSCAIHRKLNQNLISVSQKPLSKAFGTTAVQCLIGGEGG